MIAAAEDKNYRKSGKKRQQLNLPLDPSYPVRYHNKIETVTAFGGDSPITIAEETGVIVTIGRWVLQQACLDAAKWRARHAHQQGIRVSINMSGRQIPDAGLLGPVVRREPCLLRRAEQARNDVYRA